MIAGWILAGVLTVVVGLADGPPLSLAPALPVKKDRFHRFEKLRSGRIKTEKGWNVTDFAVSVFNPNLTKPIKVTWKLIADDPNFIYTNGSKGICTRKYTLKPDDGITDNVYSGLFPAGLKPWPVPAESNWTGAVEFSSDEPFYVYLLPPTSIVEGPNSMHAARKGWLLWADEVPATWDQERKQFIFPYSNYWTNDQNWVGGWYSRLILVNRTPKEVSYVINHKSYYGARTRQLDPQFAVRYGTDVADIKLKPGEKVALRLEEIFGWNQENFSSKMEGRLCVTPTPLDAWEKTDVKLYILPNKVTLESLKEKEKKALSEDNGVVVSVGQR
jgi:hypothetical protein